jgi:hypothetical protein
MQRIFLAPAALILIAALGGCATTSPITTLASATPLVTTPPSVPKIYPYPYTGASGQRYRVYTNDGSPQ